MDKVVRAFPIRSREGLIVVRDQIEKWDPKQKAVFYAHFPSAVVEEWYVQEIAGRPYLIAVTEGDDLQRGWANMAKATDEFTVWFRQKALELSDADLSVVPRPPGAEHVFTWKTG
jgi:hypothetical protein